MHWQWAKAEVEWLHPRREVEHCCAPPSFLGALSLNVRRQTFQALANPTYARLWWTNWLLYTARMMELVALSWFVLEITDSPSKVALVGVSRMLPMFLLGLVAGSLADRFSKVGVLLGVQVLNLIVGCSVLALLISGNIDVWHVYLAIFLTGTGWTLDFAARRSYYSELFAPAGLVNAISLDTASLTGSMMLGPFLGGALISLVGFSGTYAVYGSHVPRRFRGHLVLGQEWYYQEFSAEG